MKFNELKSGKVLSMASLLSVQNMALAERVKEREFLYISCLEDEILGTSGLIRCEIGSVSYVLALLCKYCLDFTKFDVSVKEYFDELDDGFLSGECNIGEEEFEEIAQFMQGCENIIIDGSFFSHPDSAAIFSFLSLLDLNVILADGDTKEITVSRNLTELKELENFDGSVVFGLSLAGVGADSGLVDAHTLVGSPSFAVAAKIKDGDEVCITAIGLDIKRKFRLDGTMKGTVAIYADNEIIGYNFKVAKISKAC